jgi:carbamoylphosphate synthase large subunit
MGDKITAKDLAEKSGIPIVPGFKGQIPEAEEAIKQIAQNVGYPLMIKASAGGGGRGMRVVHEELSLFLRSNLQSRKLRMHLAMTQYILKNLLKILVTLKYKLLQMVMAMLFILELGTVACKEDIKKLSKRHLLLI